MVLTLNMSSKSVVILCVLVSTSNIWCRKLPSYITPCKRTDPNISKCFMKAIEDLRPHLKEGVPELGIPPCDPLVIPRLELKQPQGANVGFDAVLTNLSLVGGLDFIMKDYQVDLKTHYFHMELNFPHLTMIGHYVARGKVLLVNFEGEGTTTGEYSNVTMHGTFNDTIIKKNGKDYYKVVSKEATVDIGSIHIEFDNLFRNNPQITANTNRLINENNDILFLEIKPILERTIADLVSSVVDRVNERYPYDVLFPE